MAKSASTVWLLDDDPSVLKANGRLLASAGWEIERFIDPEAFLRHAEIHHPRVVIIDMCMPRMDGLEVQRRINPKVTYKEKSNDESTRTPARQGNNRRGQKACATRAAQD